LKARVPAFLVPRRKYQVDEEAWLVRVVGPKMTMLKEVEWVALTMIWHVGGFWTHVIGTGLGQLAPAGRSAGRAISHGGNDVVLFFQWGRIPKDWELSFVLKIRESEAKGVSFHEIVKATLPAVIGDAPSFVLLRWVGDKGAKGPRQFVKVVEKMFGKSAKAIIVGLNGSLDPDAMLVVPEEPEEKFKAVIDEIQRVDAEKAARIESLTEAVE